MTKTLLACLALLAGTGVCRALTTEESSAMISPHEDWRGWLAATFPDTSAAWPARCARTFAAASGPTAWTFTQKGDLDGDGKPAALLVHLAPRQTDVSGKSPSVVDKLKVLECRQGAWRAVFGLDGKYEVLMSYDTPVDPVSPGVTLNVAQVLDDGTVTDGEDHWYLPRLGRYGGEADKEAAKSGKPGRQTARKKSGRIQTERDRSLLRAGIPHADWSTGAYLGEPAWKAWLRRQFPDRRARWGRQALPGFERLSGEGRWDFIGTGDYLRDGAPTLLLIRTRPVAGTQGRPPWTAAARLVVAAWKGGAWSVVLEVDHGRVTVDGKRPPELDNADIKWFTAEFAAATPAAPKDEEHLAYPGLSIELAPLDEKGDPFGDGCKLRYDVKGRAYSLSCG